MTPKENYQAVLRRDKPDRLPIYAANMSDFLQHYYGISAREFVDDPDAHVEVTLRGANDFGFACVAPVAYILFGAGPELGARWRFSGDSLPGSVGGIIQTGADVDKISVPREPSGYFENYLRILRNLEETAGDRIFFMGFVLGPYSAGVFLRGMENALVDPIIRPGLYRKYMDLCFQLTIFFGTHVLKIGLPSTVLLEIFLSVDLIGPDFFHRFIAPYDDRAVSCFRERGQDLPNSFGAFMGRDGDRDSHEIGRLLYDHFYGSKESLQVIRKAMLLGLPGFPPMITLSGRMMVQWPRGEIVRFLRDGLRFIVTEGRQYPVIRLTSLQPPDRTEALRMADKLRAIRDVVESFPL